MCLLHAVLVLHSYRCKIELLIEFLNKHPFMQNVLISKANSTQELMGVSKQGICITCLAANNFRIHKIVLVFKVIPWLYHGGVPLPLRWCPPTLILLHEGPAFLAHLSSFGFLSILNPPPGQKYKIKQTKTANKNCNFLATK